MYKFLKNTIYDIYNILKKDIGIIKNNKIIIAFGETKNINFIKEIIHKETNFKLEEGEIAKEYSYKKLNLNDAENYFAFIKGTNKESLNYLNIIINLIFKLFKTKDLTNEKEEFIKKMLKKNIFYDELVSLSKEYEINLDKKSLAILIENFEYNTSELVSILKKNLIQDVNFIINLNYKNIVIVKLIDENFNEDEFFKKLNEKIENIRKNLKIKINIGAGSVVENLKNIHKSFEESKIALEINKIFNEINKITNYNKLNIKILIYNMPKGICEKYLKEILNNKKIKNLNKETLFTINKFFENNLNISETSRKLFIHRNTLVYRLEKIKRIIGLDLKNFEDATKFKLALLIDEYLNFITGKEVKN